MDLKRTDDWHLHVTVRPRDHAMAATYVQQCTAVGWQTDVIENLPGDQPGGLVAPETELLPTLKARCELGQAIIVLHDVAKFFALAGWIVPRIKIEGRRQSADTLYCETHLPWAEADSERLLPLPLSRSLTNGKTYATLRSWSDGAEALALFMNRLTVYDAVGAKIEYTVYDSNRALDGPWFRSWGVQQ